MLLPFKKAGRALAEFIEKLPPGVDVVLTLDGRPVATIRTMPAGSRAAPRLGTLSGILPFHFP